MYGTKLSFARETKRDETSSTLAKDTDHAWMQICPPYLLNTIGSDKSKIDIMLNSDSFMDAGWDSFAKHYTNWQKKLSRSPYKQYLNHELVTIKAQFHDFKKYILLQIKDNWESLRKVKPARNNKPLKPKQIQRQLDRNRNAFLEQIYDLIIDIIP
eukprot:348026_1